MRRLLAVLVVGIVLVSLQVALAVDPPSEATSLEDVELDESRLRVHFIDVGPGLAVLIETPNDRLHIFVDGGDRGLDQMEEYVAHFVGEKPIDVAIVTHADEDHYMGMKRIFHNYTIKQFWYTGYTEPDFDAPEHEWNTFLGQVDDEDGIDIYNPIGEWVQPGTFEAIDDGGTPSNENDDVFVQYLNVDQSPPDVDPNSGRTFEESQRRNNASLVFKLIYNQISFLITGDINGRTQSHRGQQYDDEIDSEEFELVSNHRRDEVNFGLKSTVLQVPHHGSNGSASLEFLRAVDAEWAVIPAGHKYNHPHPDTRRRIHLVRSRILRTDYGDSTPERAGRVDPIGDDSYIFETDGQTITRLLRVTVED